MYNFIDIAVLSVIDTYTCSVHKQFSLSWRDSLEAWNKQTMVWLRMVAYERAPFQKTMVTYMLSAYWHGFYPGYYLTFGAGALVTTAGRSVSPGAVEQYREIFALCRMEKKAACSAPSGKCSKAFQGNFDAIQTSNVFLSMFHTYFFRNLL